MGRDPSRLIFEDELTGIHNRRFLHSYLEHKVHWKEGTNYPLSLLIIDLDRFKEVNDTYGHVAGDQLLTWVAALLTEVGGENGLPVRFGGDEFILLLPQTDAGGARDVTSRLLQRVRDRPFRLRDAGVAIPLTLSIGIATAPTDGTSGRELLQAADTALYHAKLSGRDQAASAREVDPKKVFPRTALHRLLASGIAGRDTELRIVSEALLAVSGGQSQFLLFEGAPGMGKTTLLDAIGRNISGDAFAVAKVGGDQQEGYRPYYLATRILVALLNQRPDGGAALVQNLGAEDLAHLSRIAPQMGEGTSGLATADEGAMRQRIFGALARFVPRVVDGRPLVLIIDDLQFADEATLAVLRVLLQHQKLPLLVCGATLEALSLGREEEAPPIERFQAARGRDVRIHQVKLPPLTREHVGDYLGSVFPNLQMPDGFDAELARLTQGNPLFLGEIIRKLVADRKVTLVGQEWVIAPIEPGYLPRSLDDVVMEKIAALDSQGRGLLEQAAAFGEDVPLSVLTGSSELDENRVLEFLDRAEALGLVSQDFERNDDVMRFLGKRVLEISYGAIDQRRREALHEHVGGYEERLYQQRFPPSASLLAYHFKRSANQEKARRYERVQQTYAHAMFNATEAARYTEQLLDEEADADDQLPVESVALIPDLLRAYMTAVRSIQLYPPDSKTIPQALQLLRQHLDAVLATTVALRFSHDRRLLLVNGQRLDVSDWTALAESVVELLDQCELQELTFRRDVSETELKTLLAIIAGSKPERLDTGFWERLAQERKLTRIQPQQMRYSKVLRMRSAALARAGAQGEEEELGPDDVAELPKILRALLGAAKVVKLYPLESEPVARAVEQLHGALQDVLGRRPTLTLAGVEHVMLANGARVDATDYQAVATAAMKLLEDRGLNSITFFRGVPVSDLALLVGALRDPPPAGAEKRFWDTFARDKGLIGLAVNERQYALSVVHGLLVADGEEEVSEANAEEAAVEQLSTEPVEALAQTLPRFGKELLVKGEYALLQRVLRRLFENFASQDPARRVKAVQACSTLLKGLILGLQHKFAELAAGFVLAALATESEPRVLRELAAVLLDMASTAIQLADYRWPSRIFLEMGTRQQQLREGGSREAEGLAVLLDRRLDPAGLKLLDEDLRSAVTERLERAAQVLGALGPTGVPLLIEVIKQENEFRSRQLASRLLAETGPQAAEQVKRALATEVIVEQRARLLEVIDMVTLDLRHELQQCLRDPNPKVRRAAFQLFERLRQDELIPLVVPLASSTDPAVARGAIRSLAPLRTPAAVQALASILETTKDASLAALCCQALGQSENAVAVDALARVLGQRRVLVFGRRWNAEVRATAAMALKQISHTRAAQVLSRYANDRESEVRLLARDGTSEKA